MTITGRLFAVVAASATLSLTQVTTVLAEDGPLPVTTGYYQFTDRSEPTVATDRKVDLWAEVYRPQDISAKPYPLIVFLHGNHGTCGRYDRKLEARVDDRSDYTTTGKCPANYVVTPNHLGYAYTAKDLASYGYIVVSINANRGITAGAGLPDDRGLNLMRGRLILRNLALLADWNRGAGQIPPPTTLGYNPVGTMDFSQVGLMGHSRGGEGARAALHQYRDRGSPFPALIGNLSIRSIFEIGPVDGQTSRVLDANGVNSIILLPSCDGDVSDLQGMHVFDRVFLQTKDDNGMRFHGTTFVWGANHNSYNTEWQTSDSPGCLGATALFQQAGQSKPQQITSHDMMIPFFRATVGAKRNGSLAGLFDPTNRAPAGITDIANIERGYLPAPIGEQVKLLETFSKETGTGDSGAASKAMGVSVVQQEASFEHQQGTRVATVSWDESSPATRYFQVNLGASRSVAPFTALSFRTALRCFGGICNRPASDKGEMTYDVSLFDINGQTSTLYNVKNEVRLSRPIGPPAPYDLHSALYTVQVPLSAFKGVDLNHVTGVRFTFERRPKGIVDVTDLALLKTDPLSNGVAPSTEVTSARMAAASSATAPVAIASNDASADGNTIKIVRQPASRQAAASAPSAGAADVDIVLTSKRSFPVTNAFPKLKVGDRTVESGTTISADGKTMTVSVPSATFNQLPANAPVTLSVLASAPVWQFGALPK